MLLVFRKDVSFYMVDSLVSISINTQGTLCKEIELGVVYIVR
jgi:hypothetical protein